jgi:hypothetical protein
VIARKLDDGALPTKAPSKIYTGYRLWKRRDVRRLR